MNKPFGRLFLLGLLVVSMLLSAALWAKPATVRAQDEGYAGDVPADSIEPAGALGPDSPFDPGDGPTLPGEVPPDNGLTPDGIPLDALAPAPETVAPPEAEGSMPGVLGSDPNANAPEILPNGGGFAYPGVSFNHLSTAANITGAVTYFDSPSLNQLPTRSVLATVLLNPVGATTSYHNHPIGVYYSATADQWSVFNEDNTTMPAGVAFNAFTPAQNSVFFTHTATVANISGDLTLIDNAYLNNNPGALVFAVPVYNPGGGGGMYYPHNIGVYYQAAAQKWGIYNEDDVNVTENSKFFVYVAHPSYDMAFKHITTAASTIGNYTVLDHPLLNDNPNAVINITHEFPSGSGQRFDQVLGAWYSNSLHRWTIYFNTSGTMPDGYSFNVLVQPNRKDSFVFKADASSILSAYPYVAVINHPLLNNNPNALVYATHNWNPFGSTSHVIDNHPLGVLYYNNQWTVYHTDFEAIPLNTYYNIYFTDAKANAYSIEAGDQNTTASTMHLSHPQLNGHTDAVFLATQNFNPGEGISGVTYGNMTYAAYGTGLWNILRVGGPDFPLEHAYNVLIPQKNSFTHTVTAGNTPAPAETCMNNALTNGQPRALVFAYVNGTPSGGGGYYLNQPIGVYYNVAWQQWCVYVENTAFTLPLGTTFNILVEPKFPSFLPLVKK